MDGKVSGLYRATALGCLLLAGCSTQSGQDFSAANASQIKSGETDKATVVKNLGQPFQKYVAPTGDETWTYFFNRTSYSPTAAAFVPFVGPMLPNSGKATADSRQMTVTFHGNIVASCNLTVTNSAATSSAMGGYGAVQANLGGGNSMTQSTNCGDAPVK